MQHFQGFKDSLNVLMHISIIDISIRIPTYLHAALLLLQPTTNSNINFVSKFANMRFRYFQLRLWPGSVVNVSEIIGFRN